MNQKATPEALRAKAFHHRDQAPDEKPAIIPVVAACIVQRHPVFRILLHRKVEAHDERGIPRNPELVGRWEFPGGMMEYGETPIRALEREIGEELDGVIITVKRLVHAQTNIYKDGVHYLVLFYECHTGYEAEPDGCRYFRPEQIRELECLPGTREVVLLLTH